MQAAFNVHGHAGELTEVSARAAPAGWVMGGKLLPPALCVPQSLHKHEWGSTNSFKQGDLVQALSCAADVLNVMQAADMRHAVEAASAKDHVR